MWTSTRCLLVVLGIAILASGCSRRIADMTLMTTRIVSLDRVDLDKLPTKRRVVGEASRWWVLFIPLGLHPTLKEAVDDALNKGGGDIMTDAVVRVSGWTAILFTVETIEVEGEVVKTRNQ